MPPGAGICHQVNLEHLGQVVATRDGVAFPDTLVGTDSHTTMINGLGVLGWGVGGIEAEAAMLGQPMFLPQPVVIGVRIDRRAAGRDHRHRPGADAHADAARPRRRGDVRRVLRRRAVVAVDRRPRDAVEHVPRVRRDRRVLPGGRARRSRYLTLHRPGRPRRPGRALREGAGAVPARRRPRADVQRDARARSGVGGALDGRAEASAGPRGAPGRVGLVPRGVPRPRSSPTRRASRSGDSSPRVGPCATKSSPGTRTSRIIPRARASWGTAAS